MNKKQIVVASSNKGKINEIKNIFDNYDVLTLKEMEEILGKSIEVTEDQDTFIENALEKVRCLYNAVGEEYLCIADDSGISIDVLNGFPGVYTARWMDADDHTKNLELLKRVGDTPTNERGCRYTTVIALKSKDFEEYFEYVLDGIVSNNLRGSNGFGFDEIFELPNGQTLAEITQEEKMSISPRKKALEMVNSFIKNKKEV